MGGGGGGGVAMGCTWRILLGNREIKHDVYFPANGNKSTSAFHCMVFVRGNG